MADNTKIEWTDATWNPVTGCSVVSAGCTNCYAMKIAGGRLKNHKSRKGLTDMSKAGPVWNGKVRFNADWFRYLRADCKKHGIPFFFKQWGQCIPFRQYNSNTDQADDSFFRGAKSMDPKTLDCVVYRAMPEIKS